MPFDEVWNIVRSLEKESEPEWSRSQHPGMKNALRFEMILKEIPKGNSGRFRIRGEFGLEFVAESEKGLWKEKIDAVRSRSNRVHEMFDDIGFYVGSGGAAHTTANYERVLKEGLHGIHDSIHGTTSYHEAMRISLEAMKNFAEKYGCSVPWEPAQTLEEALQSLWLTHVGIAFSEGYGSSLSWGHFDHYLLPYCEGRSDAEIGEALTDFFRMLDCSSFMDGAMALNLGGAPSFGGGFNRLSRQIVETMRTLRQPVPILAVHLDDSMSEEDFDLLCCQELASAGQPTFYGENACRTALLEKGLPESEVNQWAVNSCMGLILPGYEWQDMWGAVVILPTILELVLNKGKLYHGDFPMVLHHSFPENFPEFESLFSEVMKCSDKIIEQMVEENEKKRKVRITERQNPFVSALLGDCVVLGCDVLNGGVRWRTMVVETFGLVNLADAMYSIRELVYFRKKYTLGEMIEASRMNFSGYESLLNDIRKLPKYGQNVPEVDHLAIRLAEEIAAQVKRHSKDNFFCVPSLHTLNTHVWRGSTTGATLDGRHAGEPLAKNAGTLPSVKTEFTSLLYSASALPQKKFSGGQPVDLWIEAQQWSDPAFRKKFRVLLETYFERGGLQIQVNSADPAELKRAMEQPELFRNLIVRIGGFSCRFVTLNKQAQLDFIRRFQNGM